MPVKRGRRAVGDRPRLDGRGRAAGRESAFPQRVAVGLNTDDLDLRPHALDRRRNARGQSASANRNHHAPEVGDVIEQLRTDAAMTRHYLLVREWVNE